MLKPFATDFKFEPKKQWTNFEIDGVSHQLGQWIAEEYGEMYTDSGATDYVTLAENYYRLAYTSSGGHAALNVTDEIYYDGLYVSQFVLSDNGEGLFMECHDGDNNYTTYRMT